MNSIVRILQLANVHSRFCLRIKNPPHPDLVIEDTCRTGPRGFPCLSVAHYAEEWPIACEPEMLFEVRKDKYVIRLCPFYYRDDTKLMEEYSVFWNGKIIVIDSFSLAQHARFSEEWDKRLWT